jgi:GNAT superfamily N-acetyltransferase
MTTLTAQQFADRYSLDEEYRGLIVARRLTPAGTPGRRAGTLSWFGGVIDRKGDGTPDDRSNVNGGTIYKVFVSVPHRRKGVASAMLDFARERHPDQQIRHSNALSPDGAAWKQARP